jgi:Ca2+-binding RTX toxin-like protein
LANAIGTEDKNILLGTSEGDTLTGLGNTDLLVGLDGDDVLDGGDGSDVLIGLEGDDNLLGGDGNDTFVFTHGAGLDTIEDFVSGRDVIDLSGYEGITDFADLSALFDTTTSDGNTVIDLSAAVGDGADHGADGATAGDDTLTVNGITDLTETDFIFAA